MKRLKWIAGLLFLAAVPLFAWVSVTRAEGLTVSTGSGETVQSALYRAGQKVSVKGVVHGDVYCLGRSVEVDAIVYGDVLCAGQEVTVKGRVEGDIRAAGQAVTIQAKVAGSVSAAGSHILIGDQTRIDRDLTAAGTTVEIKGSVGRDALATGDAIIVSGSVGRNLDVKSEDVELTNTAVITGDFSFTGHTEAKTDEGSKITGETVHNVPAKEKRQKIVSPLFFLIIVIGFLMVSLALALLFPRFLRRTSGRMQTEFVKTLLVGIGAMVLLPAIVFLLIVSVVGIPLVFVLLVALTLAAILSGPVTGYLFGRLLLRSLVSPVWIALAGGAILATSYFIPVLGVFMMGFAFVMGLGAILLELAAHVGKKEEAETKSAPVIGKSTGKAEKDTALVKTPAAKNKKSKIKK